MALITALCPAACLEGTVFWKMNFWRSIASIRWQVVILSNIIVIFSRHLISPAKRCKEYSANLDTGPLLQVSADLHAPTTNLSNILQNPALLNRDSIYSWEPQQLLGWAADLLMWHPIDPEFGKMVTIANYKARWSWLKTGCILPLPLCLDPAWMSLHGASEFLGLPHVAPLSSVTWPRSWGTQNQIFDLHVAVWQNAICFLMNHAGHPAPLFPGTFNCPLMSTDVHWIHDTSSIGAHLSDLQHAGGGNLRQGGKSQRIASAALLSF